MPRDVLDLWSLISVALAAGVLCAILLAAEVKAEEEPMSSEGTDMELTIEQVKEKYEMQLLTSIEGITGVGIGSESGKPVIKVYVESKSASLEQKIPRRLEGYPVSIEVTGEFHAY